MRTVRVECLYRHIVCRRMWCPWRYRIVHRYAATITVICCLVMTPVRRAPGAVRLKHCASTSVNRRKSSYAPNRIAWHLAVKTKMSLHSVRAISWWKCWMQRTQSVRRAANAAFNGMCALTRPDSWIRYVRPVIVTMNRPNCHRIVCRRDSKSIYLHRCNG